MVDRVKRTPEGSSLPGFHNVILTVHITPEIWTAVVTEEDTDDGSQGAQNSPKLKGRHAGIIV